MDNELPAVVKVPPFESVPAPAMLPVPTETDPLDSTANPPDSERARVPTANVCTPAPPPTTTYGPVTFTSIVTAYVPATSITTLSVAIGARPRSQAAGVLQFPLVALTQRIPCTAEGPFSVTVVAP